MHTFLPPLISSIRSHISDSGSKQVSGWYGSQLSRWLPRNPASRFHTSQHPFPCCAGEVCVTGKVWQKWWYIAFELRIWKWWPPFWCSPFPGSLLPGDAPYHVVVRKCGLPTVTMSELGSGPSTLGWAFVWLQPGLSALLQCHRRPPPWTNWRRCFLIPTSKIMQNGI